MPLINAICLIGDGKATGNTSKTQLASYPSYTKECKASYSTESTELSHFGSSVHYGARDFYAASPSKYAPKRPKTVSVLHLP